MADEMTFDPAMDNPDLVPPMGTSVEPDGSIPSVDAGESSTEGLE